MFGKQFKKELEQLKKDVAKWQNSPEGSGSMGKIGNEELPVTGLATNPPADATGSEIAPISLSEGGSVEIRERHHTSIEVTAQVN